MKYDAQISDLKSKIDSAKKVVIFLPSSTTIDKLASALSLMLSLEKNGKDVALVTEDTVRVSHASLFGVGKIQNTLPQSGGDNFILNLGGVVDQNGLIPSLEKLDWYPEGGNLNLVFHVVPGFRFEPTNISSSYQGSKFDLGFVIGAASLNDLGSIYQQNSAVIGQIPLVNIDNSPSNSSFGLINVVDATASSASEIIMQILPSLGLNLDADIASNIIAGIYDATTNLTTNVNPDTFMVLSQAMQSGGKVISPTQQPQVGNEGFDLRQLMNNNSQPQPAPVAPQPITEPQTVNTQPVQATYTPGEPMTVDSIAAKSYEETPSGEYAVSGNHEGTEFVTGVTAKPISTEAESVNPAPDWLTPKIYKGGNLG